ncbi:M1-specific T cell receptor alpha chain-like [Pimephales promelas]|uniref:M1-specific T cell receptor alpha chain-like n=1 Tax=Pimephales promelas TaxID=90988 RepID=UPI001955C4F1|nr:M1-specific T cell receptor alpha chain-like [Pimephales promelas]
MIIGCVNDGYKIFFGKGSKVIVQSNQRKDPEVYKLEDSSCLATDFTDHSAFNSSYPTVRYTGKDYQNYYSTFDFRDEDKCVEKGSCKGASSQSGDIEKDEKINFLSLGLFWLRILFLKTVVFNVLVTFKAWMS